MVIVNPAAGAGYGKKVWPKIKDELIFQKIQFEYCIAEYEKHIVKIVGERITSGYKKFVGVGGDGTLNEIVNGIFQKTGANETGGFVIGVIPVGTGNDWIKTHGIRKNLKEAINYIKKDRSKHHDIGQIIYQKDNEMLNTYYLNIAGIGFNAMVVKNTKTVSNLLFKGRYNYIVALIISLLKFKSSNLSVNIDQKIIDNCYFTINVGVCKYNGGGMKTVPHASFNDGKLSLTLVEKISKLKVISNFFNLFNGSFIRNKEVTTISTDQVTISARTPFGVEMDGELLGETKLITFKNMSKAIRVVSTGKL